MRTPELPPQLRGHPFSIKEGLDAGLTRSRLTAADLVAPFAGVRVERDADLNSLAIRCAAAAARMTDRQFFSHLTAARLWGLRPPFRSITGALHVSAIMPQHAPRMPGIIPHRLQELHVELDLLDGLPLTTPTETWRHLSPLLSLDELVIVGDALVRRQHPFATRPQLVRALARHGGQRGAVRLRRAYEQVREGTDSARETHLRLLLLRAGLPEPAVNAEIVLPDGTITHGDLVYERQRVLVEYDGAHHRTDPRQFEQDILRVERLAAAGWIVIRVIAAHLRDPDAVARRILAALTARE